MKLFQIILSFYLFLFLGSNSAFAQNYTCAQILAAGDVQSANGSNISTDTQFRYQVYMTVRWDSRIWFVTQSYFDPTVDYDLESEKAVNIAESSTVSCVESK